MFKLPPNAIIVALFSTGELKKPENSYFSENILRFFITCPSFALTKKPMRPSWFYKMEG
jgi:hypothetical protein